jgi:hypothetical protein
MNLTGSTVRFRLLPLGREALDGVVPEKDLLEGFVVSENHLRSVAFVAGIQARDGSDTLEVGSLLDGDVGL